MSEAIEELAHFIAGTPWEAIPKAVREHAKLVLLDTVGVILAGSVQPEVARVPARLTATRGHGAPIYAPGSHAGLHERGRQRHRAERRGRNERLRGSIGAGAGAGRRRRAAERDRRGVCPAGRRWLPPRGCDRRARSAVGDRAELFPAARLLQSDLFGAR